MTQKYRRGIGTVFFKSFHITPAGVFVDSRIMIKAFSFCFIDQTGCRNEFYIDLHSLSWIFHLLIRLGDVFGIGKLLRHDALPFEKAVETGYGAFITTLHKFYPEKVVRGLDDEDLNLDNKEIMGDVYEYLLAKLSVNGTNGQFRTPRHIINMMVELMQPKLGEKICDPAMGSAGFLMESAKYILKNQKDELNNKENRQIFNSEMFYGNETDPDMLRIGTMNMTLHEVSDPQIYYKNSLTDDNKDEYKYDLILANPPFSGSLDANDLSKSLRDICPSKSTELLFLALFLRSLKIGGRCASIVPVGVVNNTNEKAYTIIRKELVENQRLKAIIYLPSEVFKPYSGVQTAIIIFDKTNNGGTDKVWLYNMESDGFSLDDKRNEVSTNDIPDIIERFFNLDKEEERTPYDKSFFISKQDIVDNNYVLSLNKYQKRKIVKKEYRPTAEIIKSIYDLEEQFTALMNEISKGMGEQ